MYSYSLNNFQYNNYNTAKPVRATATENEMPVSKPSFTSNPVIKQVPYNAAFTASALRTQLVSDDEKNKYNTLIKIADKETRKNLNILLKSGILLNTDSNDKSATLDNLYLLATTQRAQGLDNAVLLHDTVQTLAQPHVVTQQFGNIPKQFMAKTVALGNGEDVNVEHSGTCPAASIEFNLAQKHPAEFARFANGLSSPEMSVKKTIKLSNLADNTLDAIWLLNAFEIPYKADNFNEAELTFAPDKNALVRAYFQTIDRDKQERSSIDVLMQSTFMNVGSQQSYNTLTDKRAGKFNQNPKGLIEFEKTFTESVVEDKNKISVTYQKIDENAKLVGYETDFNTMKKQIVEALNMGDNVIIGYTQTDNTNTIVNGHEITIIGAKTDKQGKMTFICHDTDDGQSKPVEYSEDFLLPKIHHAGLPQSVAEKEMNVKENWVEGLETYKELKKQYRNAA
ncbi:hypothetical protein J6P92_07885 [bacterium]|nr:hypothetical protein [bacterium]